MGVWVDWIIYKKLKISNCTEKVGCDRIFLDTNLYGIWMLESEYSVTQ